MCVILHYNIKEETVLRSRRTQSNVSAGHEGDLRGGSMKQLQQVTNEYKLVKQCFFVVSYSYY